MRRVPKLVLSALVALSVALGVAPATALAEGVACDGGEGCSHVASIDDKHYETLEEAVNAVTDNTQTTITLLRNSSGNGVVVPSGKNIIFDLRNCTYDIDGDTVGSSGTETNGFQLLKGSTITFENGTITSTKAQILIQNYSNLTLDNVLLSGASLAGSAPYTLSNNCGNTVIRDSAITAKTGGFAFDVYYWPNGGYEDGVSVTVEGNSAIIGKVVYGSDGTEAGKANVAEKASLDIKGGTFNGSLTTHNLGANGDAGINITGGTFQVAYTSAWEDYVQSGMKLQYGEVVIDENAAVAKIGNVGYATLAAAIAAAGDGDTITVLKAYDATSEGTITFNADKNVTLDLGGYELTLSRFNLVQGWLTVKNGSVKSDPANGQAFNVYAGTTATDELYTKFVVEKDVTIDAAYGICLFPEPNSNAGYSSAIEVYGNIATGGIFVSGNLGNDKTNAEAMAVSGKIPTVTIYEGAVVNNGTEGQGIAMNGLANVTVKGGTITGSEAIGVKRGTLTVEGGTFISNGEYVDPADANNNGTENTGATISITSTYNYAGTIAVNLNGGTFVSENAPAVYLGHSKSGETTKTYTQGVTLNIQGGTFTSPDNVPTVYVADKAEGDASSYTKQVVSGGTFSQDLSNSGYLSDDVKYQVNHATGTFSYANDLADAQVLAQPGDGIIDLKATTDNTVTLTLDYNDGDVTQDSEYTVASSTDITLPTPTRSGYNFQGWYETSGAKHDAGTPYKVTENATLTARWSLIPAPTPTTYDVTVAEVENGEVAVDKTSASAGETVTVTATPAEGHEVASVSVTCGDERVEVTDNGDGTYAFEMPAGDVTVTVAFEASAPAVELPFTDVAEGSWYRGAVAFVYAKGLMTGYEGTTLFGPEDALGREQAAAVLHRALGAGEHAGDCGLADVVQSEWYAQAVNWAVETGLITGYGDGSGLFGVGDALTRDQFAAIVARVAKADLSKADPSALDGFSDGDEVAEWAVPAVSWAVQAGILEGSPDGDGGTELRASAQITRGEMAAMVMRAAEAGLLPTA